MNFAEELKTGLVGRLVRSNMASAVAPLSPRIPRIRVRLRIWAWSVPRLGGREWRR